MNKKIETVIIGGGQAGLSLGHYLSQAGRDYIILEKSARVADAWRNRRPDSFTLVTPNWTFQLPGGEYADSEPDGFMPKSEIVHRFEQYEQDHRFPIRYSTEVTRVQPLQDGYRYRISTNDNTYESNNVVLATGMFQIPKVPAYSADIPKHVLQLNPDTYKNPQSLPAGSVLVVGSGQSGCQIAEELHEAGRQVYLSTGSAGRVPRRYRGKDAVEWLKLIGFFERTKAALNSSRDRWFAPPHLSGKNGGHDLNLHQFYRQGIILLGHVRGFENGKVIIAPDLKENLTKADAFCDRITGQVDAHILKTGMVVPERELVTLDDGYRSPEILAVDLKAEGISTIIWATGYRMDFRMVDLDLLDADDYPSADAGVSPHPGLYFLGINWMNKFKSGLLMGIAESARHLADKISALS
jgi:putative flavoprotein involved in K+ transport